MVHKHLYDSRSTTDGVEVLWSALGITMGDGDHYLRTSYFGPQTSLPHAPPKRVGGVWEGPGGP